ELPGSTLVGMPMPSEITGLDRSDESARAGFRAELGLRDDRPVLVVTGGSSGAQRINEAFLDAAAGFQDAEVQRSEEHTSELQSRFELVCRLLLEKEQMTALLG